MTEPLLDPPEPLWSDAVRVLSAYDPPGFDQRWLAQAGLALLEARPDAVWRSCIPGHLTASVVVLDPTRESVLLTLHRRLGMWLEMGGHCEPGDSGLAAAALREATEESGIAGLRMVPGPIQLAVFRLTCSLGEPTRHFDVRYVAVAPPGVEPVLSPESLDLAWFDWNKLPEPIAPDIPPLIDLARESLDRFGESGEFAL